MVAVTQAMAEATAVAIAPEPTFCHKVDPPTLMVTMEELQLPLAAGAVGAAVARVVESTAPAGMLYRKSSTPFR